LRAFDPTAVQARAEEQETALKPKPTKPTLRSSLLGVRVNDQRLPFHFSASGPSLLEPTAVHAFDEVHETAERTLAGPVGWGMG